MYVRIREREMETACENERERVVGGMAKVFGLSASYRFGWFNLNLPQITFLNLQTDIFTTKN